MTFLTGMLGGMVGGGVVLAGVTGWQEWKSYRDTKRLRQDRKVREATERLQGFSPEAQMSAALKGQLGPMGQALTKPVTTGIPAPKLPGTRYK